MTTKTRFGGDAYKPKGLGAEPASPAGAVPTPAPSHADAPVTATSLSHATAENDHSSADALTLAALKGIKVPFSSRITVAADRQLKALAREGHSQTDLLAEALNLLFEKYDKKRVA